MPSPHLLSVPYGSLLYSLYVLILAPFRDRFIHDLLRSVLIYTAPSDLEGVVVPSRCAGATS